MNRSRMAWAVVAGCLLFAGCDYPTETPIV